jgi:hypothetical protein
MELYNKLEALKKEFNTWKFNNQQKLATINKLQVQ